MASEKIEKEQQEGFIMPKVTGPDGVEREISMEEFLAAISDGDAQLVGAQRVVSDSRTGEVLHTTDLPVSEDGTIDVFSSLFGGGLFGDLFEDTRTLEEKIRDAQDGDEETMEELAMLFLNGDDEVEADPESAVYWFTKLAELDNSDSQFNLALHCAKGHGIERSFEQAASWAQRAADNGDPDAPALVEKYRKWAAASEKIETGDVQAMADLAAGLMELGRSLDQAGVGNDYADSVALAQKAAEQGNGDGIWTLALAYEHGRGVEADVEKAVEYYRKGAELGHAPSQHSLGCYYMRGDGVEEDHGKGFALMMDSANQGYALAVQGVANCYQFGHGVEEDMKLAIEWYEKYLELEYDPEIAQKVALFKILEEAPPFDADH